MLQAEGSDLLITKLTAEKKTYHWTKWTFDKTNADIEPVKVEFKGQYENFVVKETVMGKNSE